MGETEVCLKWNTFHESIISSFELLWEEEDLVDVTIAAGDQLVYAHKVILSACSPFFKKLFQETNCKHPVLILPGINVEDLKMLLRFVYKGEVFIIEEHIPQFLKLAEYLQIRGLWKPPSSQLVNQSQGKDICEQSVETHNTDNADDNHSDTATIDTDSKGPAFTSDEPNINDEPPVKRFKRNYNKNCCPTVLECNSIIPSCKAEIKEIDKEIFAVVDSQFSNTLLEWQKIKPVFPETEKPTNFQPTTIGEQDIRFPYMSLPYADLLPSPITLQMWAQNRTLDQFACDLMKMLFSTEERIVCNVNGKMGKLQFNVNKVNLIREVIQSFSNLSASAFEEQWKICVTKIDTANRGLKRRFKSKEVVFCDRTFTTVKYE